MRIVDGLAFKPRSLVFALAMLLCAGQIAAAQHAIGHLAAAPDHACAQCLHQSGHKNVLTSCPPAAIDAVPTAADFSFAAPSRSGAPSSPYRSRAPPISRR